MRRYGGGRETADIVQDVMVAACSAIEGYRGDASIRAWLWRIAFNQTLKNRQEQRARERREAAGQWWCNGEGSCPGAQAEARERVRSLRRAFASLPRELQQAFIDRLDGRTFAAMSRRDAVSIGTAHRRAQLARTRLAEAVADR